MRALIILGVVLALTFGSVGAVEMPRVQAPCAASEWHIIVAREGDDLLISGLLWEAGVPEGTTVRFYHGSATAPENAIHAPPEPSPEWAASLLCA